MRKKCGLCSIHDISADCSQTQTHDTASELSAPLPTPADEMSTAAERPTEPSQAWYKRCTTSSYQKLDQSQKTSPISKMFKFESLPERHQLSNNLHKPRQFASAAQISLFAPASPSVNRHGRLAPHVPMWASSGQ